MSLNKFMHPRNIYKTPPSFKELAVNFPEFRKYAKQDIAGKVSFDFKDREALRVLTTTLLKKDFDLDVEIPRDRLVPTLPLRLNYLLWIEDLLSVFRSTDDSGEVVCGIDVGTGASCIYPLLAAKKNGWHMLATEVDTESAAAALKNVERNNLQHLIEVKQVPPETILVGAVLQDQPVDFSMCNPPFFGSEEELSVKKRARSSARPQPHNAQTGSVAEVVAPGGEVAFISGMIHDSLQLGNAVRIYTTMVGVKSSLKPLQKELEQAGIKNVALTEFCQGNTMRWGLAWSMTETPRLQTTASPSAKAKKKLERPMVYPVPSSCGNSIDTVSIKVRALLESLQIICKEIKKSEKVNVMEITAKHNTWVHQRRARRAQKQELLRKEKEKEKHQGQGDNSHFSADKNFQQSASSESDFAEDRRATSGTANQTVSIESVPAVDSNTGGVTDISKLPDESALYGDTTAIAAKRSASDFEDDPDRSAKKLKVDGSDANTDATETIELNAILTFRREEGSHVVLDLLYMGGNGGKNALHQILQVIRNKWH